VGIVPIGGCFEAPDLSEMGSDLLVLDKLLHIKRIKAKRIRRMTKF
jgi:hypothetical protein